MKIFRLGTAFILSTLLSFSTFTNDSAKSVSLSDPQAISWNDVPEAVQRTLKSHAGVAEITEVQKGHVANQPVYSGAFLKDGKTTQVLVTENGSLFIGENQVAWNQLPSAVQESYRSLNNMEALQTITEQNQNGRKTYEFSLLNEGQPSRMQLAEDGKIVGLMPSVGGQISESAGAPRPRGVKFSELPAAAQKTIQEISGTAPLEKIQQELVDGAVHYEVTFQKDNQPMTVCVSSDGRIVK